jgi:hypothetical protein
MRLKPDRIESNLSQYMYGFITIHGRKGYFSYLGTYLVLVMNLMDVKEVMRFSNIKWCFIYLHGVSFPCQFIDFGYRLLFQKLKIIS